MREWLREYRKASGKSQQEVAEEAQISQSYYAALERGIRGNRIAACIARRIAEVLGFEWTRFYEDADDKAAQTGDGDGE